MYLMLNAHATPFAGEKLFSSVLHMSTGMIDGYQNTHFVMDVLI